MESITWKSAGLFMALLGAVSIAQAQGPGGGRGNRAEMMERFDTNGDGELDQDEREAMREEMKNRRGERKGEGEEREGEGRRERPSAEQIVERFDKDGSGELSATELEAFMQEQRERMRKRMEERDGDDGDGERSGRGGRGGGGGGGGGGNR